MASKDEDQAKVEQAKALKALEQHLAEDTVIQQERARLLARWKKVQFDGYIAEGFTEAQALQLVK